jgi:hypothetical protein
MIFNGIMYVVRVYVWEKALLWDEVNTQAWVLLNKGATHFYSILGIKD